MSMTHWKPDKESVMHSWTLMKFHFTPRCEVFNKFLPKTDIFTQPKSVYKVISCTKITISFKIAKIYNKCRPFPVVTRLLHQQSSTLKFPIWTETTEKHFVFSVSHGKTFVFKMMECKMSWITVWIQVFWEAASSQRSNISQQFVKRYWK